MSDVLLGHVHVHVGTPLAPYYASSKLDDLLAAFLIAITIAYALREKLKGHGPYHHLWFEQPQAHANGKAENAENNIAKVLQESVSVS